MAVGTGVPDEHIVKLINCTQKRSGHGRVKVSRNNEPAGRSPRPRNGKEEHLNKFETMKITKNPHRRLKCF